MAARYATKKKYCTPSEGGVGTIATARSLSLVTLAQGWNQEGATTAAWARGRWLWTVRQATRRRGRQTKTARSLEAASAR